jgi:hypothetical protein
MPDFESGAFNRALPPLRDGYCHFPLEFAGARRPAIQIRKQRKSTKPALRSTHWNTPQQFHVCTMRMRIISLPVSPGRWQFCCSSTR